MRLENNKSQKELAKYLEIDLSTYNNYEKNSRKLSNEVVKKLAEYISKWYSRLINDRVTLEIDKGYILT